MGMASGQRPLCTGAWTTPAGTGGGRARSCPPSSRGRVLLFCSSVPEPLSKISFNALDGPRDRRSFHGAYVVQDGLPL